MSVWAIADLHLSFGVENKQMDVFGPQWVKFTDKLQHHWLEQIHQDDLILIPGDISWAMKLEEVRTDLEWIDALPGTKVIIKGNHDYWWSSLSKVKQILPPSIHVIQNNAFHWNDLSIGGARLWDTEEYSFDPFIDFQETTVPTSREKNRDAQKIFNRELDRLELSLKALDQKAHKRIAMTHFPPISADLKPSRAAALLEKYHVQVCVFGHLHSLKAGVDLFGGERGIHYYLTSCDYLDFKPLKLL